MQISETGKAKSQSMPPRGQSGLMRTFLSVAMIALGPSAANSQQSAEAAVANSLRALAGTTSVTAEEQRSEGVLQTCYMEFAHLAQDWIYKQGAFIRIGGSIGMMSVSNGVGITLKVSVHDVNPRTMTFTPSPPASAYFMSGGKSSRPFFVSSTESDTPGALFSVYKLEAIDVLMDALVADKLVVSFNRKKGGTDIQVPIDLTVAEVRNDGSRVRSPDAVSKFNQCMMKLLGATLPKDKR